MYKPKFDKMKITHGFSIIELLVSLGIVGIIGAVAYPSYITFLQNGRRTDAQIALTKGAALMENYYYQNGNYTNTASTIWPNGKSPEGFYNMSITLDVAACGGAPCFVLTATATGLQASDTACATLTLDSQEDKGSSGGGNCW